MAERTCGWCGKKFNTIMQPIPFITKVYCSKKCEHEAKEAKKKG